MINNMAYNNPARAHVCVEYLCGCVCVCGGGCYLGEWVDQLVGVVGMRLSLCLCVICDSLVSSMLDIA